MSDTSSEFDLLRRTMRKAKMQKMIDDAMERVRGEISGHAAGGRIASALASEGYSGGYFDALCDIQLLINDVIPNRRNYWPQGAGGMKRALPKLRE